MLALMVSLSFKRLLYSPGTISDSHRYPGFIPLGKSLCWSFPASRSISRITIGHLSSRSCDPSIEVAAAAREPPHPCWKRLYVRFTSHITRCRGPRLTRTGGWWVEVISSRVTESRAFLFTQIMKSPVYGRYSVGSVGLPLVQPHLQGSTSWEGGAGKFLLLRLTIPLSICPAQVQAVHRQIVAVRTPPHASRNK